MSLAKMSPLSLKRASVVCLLILAGVVLLFQHRLLVRLTSRLSVMPKQHVADLSLREADLGIAALSIPELQVIHPEQTKQALELVSLISNGTVSTNLDTAAVETTLVDAVEAVSEATGIPFVRGPPPKYDQMMRESRQVKAIHQVVALQEKVDSCHSNRAKAEATISLDLNRNPGQSLRSTEGADNQHGFNLKNLLFSTTCENRMPVDEFLCEAQCPSKEPELERMFRIFSITKYNLRGLLRMCKAEVFPFLVWIRKNEVLYQECQMEGDITGKRTFHEALYAIKDVACAVELPDVLFGFDGNDYAVPQSESPFKYSSEGWTYPLPQVMRFVGTDASPCPLFPTPPFLRAVRLSPSGSGMRRRVEKPLWSKRNDDIFWRGGTTGIPFDVDIVYMMPRPELVRRFKDTPGFDVALTTLDGVSKSMIKAGFLNMTRSARLASKSTFAEHRYHVHIDGNSASWGLISKLFMQSVVLWHRSPVTYREHYYDILQAWEHYVPVNANFDNLPLIREWLNTPEGAEEARLIHERISDLMKNRFRLEDTVCYIVRLLYSMASLQNYKPFSNGVFDAVGGPMNLFASNFKSIDFPREA
mmetsp:Transcript_2068/g.4708  ORF Transcript_2068/g.4708 Transcript_2068/m.4708 type:complete len:589 (+) Transcript_2068:103-1869(+)